jgi:arylformamidase
MKHHLNALRRCCALSAFAGIAAVWTLIASPLAAQVRRHLDLPYAQREGVPPGLLSLDLYAPEKSSKHGHAVLVMIHGGGWRNGDKRNAGMVRSKVPHFVGSGFVYISLNYRLSRNPRVRHPDHVQDVAAALAWVHNHVARFGGDPERIFVMGHSAGAHLATLVAVNGRLLAAHGKPLSILKGAIALDTAAYDIPRYVLELGARPQVRQMFELAFGKSESMWRDASPRHHVNKVIEEVQAKGADRSASTKIPPILLFHAGKRLASATLSKELVTRIALCGRACADHPRCRQRPRRHQSLHRRGRRPLHGAHHALSSRASKSRGAQDKGVRRLASGRSKARQQDPGRQAQGLPSRGSRHSGQIHGEHGQQAPSRPLKKSREAQNCGFGV